MNFGYCRCQKEQTAEEVSILQKMEQVVESRFIFIEDTIPPDGQGAYFFMRNLLRAGDCLYIDSLGSLGNDLTQIADEWQYLTEQVGAAIVVMDGQSFLDSRQWAAQIDDQSVQTKFLYLLRYLGQVQQRQKTQVQQARKKLGRPSLKVDEQLFAETVARWRNKEIDIAEACRIVGCARSSWYKYIRTQGYQRKQKKTEL